MNKSCQQNKRAGWSSLPCQGSSAKLCSSLWRRCAHGGRCQECRGKVMAAAPSSLPVLPPNPVLWDRGETACCQHCRVALLSYGCPVARFRLLSGHLGNSPKKKQLGIRSVQRWSHLLLLGLSGCSVCPQLLVGQFFSCSLHPGALAMSVHELECDQWWIWAGG